MYLKRLNTALRGNEANWTFIGVPTWRQDHEGLIYPQSGPTPTSTRIRPVPPNAYAHELAREDVAFLRQPLEDTDISVDYKMPLRSRHPWRPRLSRHG